MVKDSIVNNDDVELKSSSTQFVEFRNNENAARENENNNSSVTLPDILIEDLSNPNNASSTAVNNNPANLSTSNNNNLLLSATNSTSALTPDSTVETSSHLGIITNSVYSNSAEPSPLAPAKVSFTPEFKTSCAELLEINENKDLEKIRQRFKDIEGLGIALRCSVQYGLSTDEAESQDRIKEFGKNIYPKPKGKLLIVRWLEALKDPMLIILIILSIVSIILSEAFPDHPDDRKYNWIEGVAILAAVLIVSSVTALNDWSKDRQFRRLSEENKKIMINVHRDGSISQILVDKLVVGDVVELAQGDSIPADGVLIQGYNLKTDESVMTGETDMVKKDPERPFMLSGCQVSDGNGKMLVTAVGANSEWGQTIAKLVGENPDTPLQSKLERLAGDIGKMGIGFSIATVVILIAGFIIRDFIVDRKPWEWGYLNLLVKFLVIGVTIIVVAVPEGLPLAVTMSLAFSVRKMMKDNNLVRHLAACETMGGATNICSDKTGTLTLNQMRVVKAWIAGVEYFDELPNASMLSPNVINLLCDGMALNSRATIKKNEDPNKEFDTIGNKTECALLIMHEKLQRSYEDTRNTYAEKSAFRQVYTFSSDKKRMSTIVKLEEGGYRIFTKGAAEIVLGICKTRLDTDGSVRELTDEDRENLSKAIIFMADSGLRTICMAYKDMENDDPEWDNEAPESDLTCIAIVGIKDPLRPEVKGAVEQCRKSGIFVRMVTGDNLLTARYIARDCGILTEEGMAMEGKDFRKLADYELDKVLPKLQVLARSTPSDKYKLVQRLRELGEVVAVTGDGTNDAPALKEADVGLSMGLSGTEVAKEASDIIIMDDNFNSIVKSVLWGRSIYENIKKFLQFQLTVNLVALFLLVITSITTFILSDNSDKELSPPLTAIQLLWVNLIMDTFAALALATEPPSQELLKRKPYGRYDHLITSNMMKNISFQVVFQLIILCILYYFGQTIKFIDPLDPHPKETLTTAIFNMFVFSQLYNEINSRKVNRELNVLKNIHRSPLFILIWIFTGGVQAIMVELGGKVMDTTGLNWYQWLITALVPILCMPIAFFARLIPVPERKPAKPKKKKQKKKDLKVDVTVITDSKVPESEDLKYHTWKKELEKYLSK